MNVDSFYDTNILLYALSTDPAEAAKRAEARRLLARGDWGVSIQVLQEFYVNSTRPSRPALTDEDARAAVRAFLERPCAVTDAPVLVEAMEIRREFRISLWDAAIVAAARSLGARKLVTEDLQDGQEFRGLRVVNPFRTATRQA